MISFITLKVNKIGTINFYSCDEISPSSSPNPDEVYINNIKHDPIVTSFYFNETDSTVKLLWKNNIDTTQNIFRGCSDITEINLSNFDASQVTDMGFIFKGCSSLISIDFTNLNTANIKNLQGIFDSCSSLTSLDLSNFDTSKVTALSGSFFLCSGLISLDLSNFNTTFVGESDYMFYGCNALVSLDLSNFNIRGYFDEMFSQCDALEYINLENAIFTDNFYSQISSLLDRLIVCSKNSKFSEYSELCECINCKENMLDNNNFMCYKKCTNTINNINNMCEKCGKNYYKIYEESNNDNAIIDCYQSLEGYYLEDLFYKQCFSSCKTCDNGGTEENHNCKVCKESFIYQINKDNYLNCYDISCPFYHYTDINNNKVICTDSLNCPEPYNKLIINKSECIDDCTRDSEYKFEHEGFCYNKQQNLISTEIITSEIDDKNDTNKENVLVLSVRGELNYEPKINLIIKI